MYSEIVYSGFDVLRETGMRILHRLVHEIVRVRNQDQRVRANVDVEYVYDARMALGLKPTISMVDADKLLPCPSRESIVRGRGDARDRGPRAGLIDILSGRYAQRAQQAAARAPALGDVRGAEREMLIDLYSESFPEDCLFLPDKYFSQLTRWVFAGVEGTVPALSPGARNLIQLTVEETLLWII